MDKKDTTFESAMARLEEIVKTLEGTTVELDKSLSLFEEGIALVKFCNEKLDTAEKKIKVIEKTADGKMSEKDFESV